MTEQTGDQSREIGFQVRQISHLIKHTVDRNISTHAQGEMTRLQAWILGYLYDNREKEIYQKDIQTHFSISRSTTTGVLQTMEKNDLVSRESVEWDARLKKICLTQKSLQMQEELRASIRQTEDLIASILTPEEHETFLRLGRKLATGIVALQQSQNGKEGSTHD